MKEAMYQYKATLLKVIDGDTIDIEISLGFHSYIRERCRLAHIDTPELHSPDAVTRDCAKKAMEMVSTLLADKAMVIQSLKPFTGDKYGRWLVEVISSDGTDVNQRLIDAGLAVAYEGGAKV